MLKLHKFGPAFDLPDASPFVVKVETYLRMTAQEYETTIADVRKAPRKQLPVIEVGGQLIADSTRIVSHLEAARPQKLDAHLDAKQRAVALAFKSMLEEHLYFGVLYMRWATDDGWAVFAPTLRDMLGKMGVPSLMRGFVSNSARKDTVARGRTQGLGRQPRAEIVATCAGILDAVDVHLGDGPYFCGDKPTTYDATVYAFARVALCPAFDNELRQHASKKDNLVAYADRMTEQHWKDAT